MVCPSVRRGNPRALASGLLTVQAGEPCSISLCSMIPGIDHARNRVSHAKDLGVWRFYCATIKVSIFFPF